MFTPVCVCLCVCVCVCVFVHHCENIKGGAEVLEL